MGRPEMRGIHLEMANEALGQLARLVLADAQTSGGLLISAPGQYAQTLLDILTAPTLEQTTSRALESSSTKPSRSGGWDASSGR